MRDCWSRVWLCPVGGEWLTQLGHTAHVLQVQKFQTVIPGSKSPRVLPGHSNPHIHFPLTLSLYSSTFLPKLPPLWMIEHLSIQSHLDFSICSLSRSDVGIYKIWDYIHIPIPSRILLHKLWALIHCLMYIIVMASLPEKDSITFYGVSELILCLSWSVYLNNPPV